MSNPEFSPTALAALERVQALRKITQNTGTVTMSATDINNPWIDHEELIPEEKWYPFYRRKDGTLADHIFPDATEEDWQLLNTPAESEHCYGDNYVVGMPSNDDGFEGWFPLGSLSLVFGSTGAGKSTWVLDMLAAQLRGERFAGKQTYGLPYIVLMQDRNEHSLNRTLRRMHLDPAKVPLRILPTDSFKRDPAVVIEEFYFNEEVNWKTGKVKPRVVFIEGLDIWVPKASDKDYVAPVLKNLETVANHYNLALIATTGSPKMKPKEVYAVTRDTAFGSQVWGRMVETMVQVLADQDTGRRFVTVMPRNGKEEKFTTTFQGGRLVVQEGIKVVIDATPNRKDGTKKEAFLEWWKEGALWDQAEEIFGISRRTFYEWQAEARARVREP